MVFNHICPTSCHRRPPWCCKRAASSRHTTRDLGCPIELEFEQTWVAKSLFSLFGASHVSRHNLLWCKLMWAQWERQRRWRSLICCHLHICNAVRLTGFPWCPVSGSNGVGFLQCVELLISHRSAFCASSSVQSAAVSMGAAVEGRGFRCQHGSKKAPGLKRTHFNSLFKVLSPSCLHKPAQREVWRHGHCVRNTKLHSVPWGGKASRESWGLAPHPTEPVRPWH